MVSPVCLCLASSSTLASIYYPVFSSVPLSYLISHFVSLLIKLKMQGEKDWEKYEVARKLKSCVDSIRNEYLQDLKSKQMVTRQRAVALYFIDKLALRAGNEKEEGETADTVGCCSLRVEHIILHEQLDANECVVEFDFLGKDSIRYYNKVPVIKKVLHPSKDRSTWTGSFHDHKIRK
ncbi:DNA topoisomerase 1 [Xenotaenia resolanae]|uniref:DNA topoisomerase n=2 Tax=Goodeidae TaxID=28758 RepID=A0ABV0W585_9TELE